MESVHDLGGKQGFGPIDINEAEVPFKYEWEGRMWGISSCSGSPDWTIDWWRHVREAIDPVDYLTRPYFDSWAQTELAAYVDSGVFSLEEAISGKCHSPVEEKPSAITVDEAIAADKKHNRNYQVDANSAPLFTIGDAVRMKNVAASHHTRLPAYVRGKPGQIARHHGAHIFADLSARGMEEGQHLYSVEFYARDLWPECNNSLDKVYLDLWESYLEAEE